MKHRGLEQWVSHNRSKVSESAFLGVDNTTRENTAFGQVAAFFVELGETKPKTESRWVFVYHGHPLGSRSWYETRPPSCLGLRRKVSVG